MVKEIGTADASASRSFFVEMLTRDITLEDCILDLLDNSVDGAWSSLGLRAPTLEDKTDLSSFNIKIEAKSSRFVIEDDCGGMTKERAESHAFTFGRQNGDKTLGDGFTIGVYGIGMKRAIFKIGESISIRSTYKSGTKSEAFEVPIDVRTWMRSKSRDWKFPILEATPRKRNGVVIDIRELTAATRDSFANPAFQENLRRVISRDYALHLHRGLNIILNGEPIEPWDISLLEGGEFQPQRATWTVQTSNGEVRVEMLAGAATPPPDDEGPDEEDSGEQRFGWYVACNGRIVLAADKTNVTIWGLDKFPIWHRQYRGFIGLLLFTSEKTQLLPLTTTKRSVDLSSEIYRQTRPAMRDATRVWIDYTNARKQDREAAKAAERSAQAKSIFGLSPRAIMATPKLVKQAQIRSTYIQYSMPTKKIRALAAKLGSVNMPATKVGQKSFDYAYEDMVGDE